MIFGSSKFENRFPIPGTFVVLFGRSMSSPSRPPRSPDPRRASVAEASPSRHAGVAAAGQLLVQALGQGRRRLSGEVPLARAPKVTDQSNTWVARAPNVTDQSNTCSLSAPEDLPTDGLILY